MTNLLSFAFRPRAAVPFGFPVGRYAGRKQLWLIISEGETLDARLFIIRHRCDAAKCDFDIIADELC